LASYDRAAIPSHLSEDDSKRRQSYGLQRRRHSAGDDALYAWGVLLTPALGAVLMAASTAIVAINPRLLRLKKPQ